MEAIAAVKEAAALSGTPLTHVGPALGMGANYVSAIASRGSTPRADTLAALLGACGYALCAVPRGSVPPGAIVVDPPPDRGTIHN